jgi:hypothetical protein
MSGYEEKNLQDAWAAVDGHDDVLNGQSSPISSFNIFPLAFAFIFPWPASRSPN